MAVVFVVPIWYTWLLLVLEVQLLPEAGAAAWSSVEQRGGRAFCRCHRAQAFRGCLLCHRWVTVVVQLVAHVVPAGGASFSRC